MARKKSIKLVIMSIENDEISVISTKVGYHRAEPHVGEKYEIEIGDGIYATGEIVAIRDGLFRDMYFTYKILQIL
jgi:hypothetical protein